METKTHTKEYNTISLNREELDKYLDKSYSLIYIDYRDELTDDQIQSIIKGDIDDACDSIDENIIEFLTDSAYTVREEVEEEILKDVATNEDDVLDDETREELLYMIEERDDSQPFSDLVRNTSRQWVYIQLDSVSQIKKMLSAQQWREVSQWIEHTPAGFPALLFTADIDDLVKLHTEAPKNFTIDGVLQIGWMDRYTGSGWMEEVETSVSLPYMAGLLQPDDGSGYGYAVDVAGICATDAVSVVHNTKNKAAHSIRLQKTSEAREVERMREKQEQEYKETYKKGLCTFGDIDIKRHRNTEYINNFPCGIKCKDCGYFWID